MRPLPSPAPLDCLEEARKDEEKGKWEDVDSACRREVRTSLVQNQDCFCVWCERRISQSDCHADHIMPQNQNPTKRRDITNLAASCNTKGTCGQHKSGQDIDPTLHLFPYEEPDLAALFTFLPNGDVTPSPGDQNGKAAYMIRLYGLDSPKLTYLRNRIATTILKQVDVSESDLVRETMLANPSHFPSLHQQLLS